MTEMKVQIEELVTLLKAKGYDGDFQINGGPAVPLQSGLEAYLDPNRVLMGDNHRYPLYLMIHSRYRNHEDRTLCTFQVSYGEKKGFGIDGMRMSRYIGKNIKPINKELFPGSWEKVPTADAVNRMIGWNVRQKRKKL